MRKASNFHHQIWYLNLNRNCVPTQIYNPQINNDEPEERKEVSSLTHNIKNICNISVHWRTQKFRFSVGQDSAKHSGTQSVHSAPRRPTSELIQLACKALCIDSWRHCGLCTRNACAWTSSIQREVSNHIKRTGHCLKLWTWHGVPAQELGSRNFTMHALLISMTSLCKGRQPEDVATFSCGPSQDFRINQCEDEVEDRY